MSSQRESEAPYLQNMVFLPNEPEEQRYQLEKNYRDISNCINTREIALYETIENETGQQWFQDGNVRIKRLGFRKCLLKTTTGAVTNIPHGIDDVTSCRFVKIYGTLQNSPFTAAVPLPSAGPNPVFLGVGATNATINDSTTAYVGYHAIVVLEYVRDR